MLKSLLNGHVSRLIRKPTISICKNKDTDGLCSHCTADQCLYFCSLDSMLPLLTKSFLLFYILTKASYYFLWLYSLVCARPGQKPGRPVSLTSWLIIWLFVLVTGCRMMLKFPKNNVESRYILFLLNYH